LSQNPRLFFYSVHEFIGGENDSREAFKRSASADIIQFESLSVTVTVESKQLE